jgi:hypothetical protein
MRHLLHQLTGTGRKAGLVPRQFRRDGVNPDGTPEK